MEFVTGSPDRNQTVIALGGLYDTANAYSAPKNNHHGDDDQPDPF